MVLPIEKDDFVDIKSIKDNDDTTILDDESNNKKCSHINDNIVDELNLVINETSTTAFETMKSRRRKTFGSTSIATTTNIDPDNNNNNNNTITKPISSNIQEFLKIRQYNDEVENEGQQATLWEESESDDVSDGDNSPVMNDNNDDDDDESIDNKIVIVAKDSVIIEQNSVIDDEISSTEDVLNESNEQTEEQAQRQTISDTQENVEQDTLDDNTVNHINASKADENEPIINKDESKSETNNNVDSESLTLVENENENEKILIENNNKELNNENELNEISILNHTDYLFSKVTDKLQVTVKDIIKSICVEYNVKKLSKILKDSVRQRLIELIEKEQNEMEAESEDNDDKEEEEENNDEKSIEEAEDSDNDVDVSGASDGDDDEDFDLQMQKKATKKKKHKKEKKIEETKEKISRIKKPRKVNMKIQKSAMRIQQDQLRKRRLEELRVRTEELQAVANKQDQERAELIAAKFDTNREDMRMHRLEQRLDLLQKLDQKRINCVVAPESLHVIHSKKESENVSNHNKKEELDNIHKEKDTDHDIPSVAPIAESEIDDSSDDSDSDMELEIIGDKSNKLQMLKFTEKQTTKQITSPMSLLDLADQSKLHVPSRSKLSSPKHSMDARAQLRHKLLMKQRTMGNNWLARELGYKSHIEHLQDCRITEDKKREMIRKREEERVKSNERKLMRERMLKLETEIPQEEHYDDDDGDEEYKPDNEETEFNDNIENEEEDEELALARAIEEENANKDNGEDDKSKNGPSSNVQDDDAEIEFVHLENNGESQNSKLGSSESIKSTSDVKEFPTEDNMKPLSEGDSSEIQLLETQVTIQNSNNAEGCLIVESDIEINDTNSLNVSSSMKHSTTSSNTDIQVKLIQKENVENDNESPELDLLETQPQNGMSVSTSTVEQTIREETIDQENEEVEASCLDDASISDTITSDNVTIPKDDFELDDNNEGYSADKDEAKSSNVPRNSAWRAMLAKEAEQLKKKKRSNLVEEEADEEEEEQVVGLEDFGFTVAKKKKDDDDEDELDDDLDEDDLEDVVDDVSDGEGDEEAGELARKEQDKKEEKERHKEMLRRMRDGYDGRRGGIAVGAGARGNHRFDQLVAADNKEDAKRLGLLNDDELDSEDEEGEKPEDDDEDEAGLIDKMLKDRFLQRSSEDPEAENFSDDEDNEENVETIETGDGNVEDEEEREQERLAKRFAKRARMQRLLEAHEHEEEFSQLKLMEEDTTLKQELLMMKNGLARKRSQSSQSGTNSMQAPVSVSSDPKKQKTTNQTLAFSIFNKGGSLALALQSNRHTNKTRTSFVRTGSGGSSSINDVTNSSFQKSIAFNHVVFHSSESQSQFSKSNKSNSNIGISRMSSLGQPLRSLDANRKSNNGTLSSSLFSKSVTNGFQKRK